MRITLITGLMIAAVPATIQAAVVTIGSSNAHLCYESARRSVARGEDIAFCDAALEENLMARDRAATFVNRGVLRIRAKEHDLALADFESAIAVDETLGEAYLNKGVALLDVDDDGAVAALTKALVLKPERPQLAHFGLAAAFENKGDLRRAYREYRAAAELDPRWSVPRAELRRFRVAGTEGQH